VTTGTKQQSQSTTTLKESARERRGKKEKEECWGTNQNRYGVCERKNSISKSKINNNREATAKKFRKWKIAKVEEGRREAR